MTILDIHKKLLSGKLLVNDLVDIRQFIQQEYNRAMRGELVDKEMEALIRILIDYYIYSSNGDVIVTDSQYDALMREWVGRGNSPITTADDLDLNVSTWPMIEHRARGMVGSLRKIYTEEELDNYLFKVIDRTYYIESTKYDTKVPEISFVVAPKFDGSSMYFEIRNHNLVFAATRGDGFKGQDLLQVVKVISKRFDLDKAPDGFYKCELVMSTDDFSKLIKEKPYRNRRSAVTGIVNSPKNLDYARYLTPIILAHYDPNGYIEYSPRDSVVVTSDNYHSITKMVKKAIDNIASICRDPDYPYRTDGVVLYPLQLSSELESDIDIMEEAIAFKFNTAENKTRVEDVYISIGRMGGATPVARVRPVDVNETTVTDVSLSNFDKFEKLDLHYNQEVVIFSAGDVIPQLKLPKKVTHDDCGPKIKLKKICPYCNHDLVQDSKMSKDSTMKEKGKLWRCANPQCPRVVSGRIANFVSKVGGESIADKTIDLLYTSKRIRNISDLLSITYNNVIDLEGFSDISSTLLEEEIKRIRTKETKSFELLSALGIPGIGTKTSKLILSRVPLKKILKMKKGEIIDELLELDGIGVNTAEKFAEYIKENRDTIKDIASMMNIIDGKYISNGNVTFTGFRSTEWEEKFNDLNIDVDDSVNRDTIAVFAADLKSNSTKLKKARKLDIPIYERYELELVYDLLKKSHIRRDEFGNIVNPLFE